MLDKKLAILITCHNRQQNTLKCLRALYKAGLPQNHNIEVFLVDDGSTDGTGSAVKNEFPMIHIIQGSGQLYWNRGMRLAWQTAAHHQDYDFYLWLNDDTYLFPDSILTLINDSIYTNHQALICGSTVSAITGEITYGGSLINGERVMPSSSLNSCTFVNGNCVLIPKIVFETVGFLDPLFPHTIGDYDYGLRAKHKGIKLFVASKLIGYCEQNQSLPQWCLQKNPLFKRLKNLYSPLGNSHPIYYFKYEIRHFGMGKAILHFVTIHLRVIFPGLWKN